MYLCDFPSVFQGGKLSYFPSDIRKDDPLAEKIRQTGLINWDEVTMQHCFIVEAVDRTLRDFLENDVPFGGITVAWGGDFIQTLPVIVGASRGETVGATIQNSYSRPMSRCCI